MLDDIRHFLERQRLHGVLILPPISENDALASLCAELGCEYVRMGSAELDADAHLVASNDREAVAAAIDHLIGMGHQRIGFVAGPDGFRSARERELGYTDAMAARKYDHGPARRARGNYTFDSGYQAGERLLEVSPRPTAIFASNDEMAAGVLHAARERGLEVPRDLSIIGFDDTAIAAHIWPPLTTVRWPLVSMARAAALKLIAPEAAEEQPSRFLSDLIRRQSASQPTRDGNA